MSESNIKIIDTIYDAFNRRDYESVLASFDANFEWIAADNSPLADQSPYHGVDAIRTGVFDRIAAGFEKLEVIADEIFAAEGRVVVLGHYHGRFTGGTDELRFQVAHIWTVRNGRACKFQQYVDTLKIAQSAQANAASGK